MRGHANGPGRAASAAAVVALIVAIVCATGPSPVTGARPARDDVLKQMLSPGSPRYAEGRKMLQDESSSNSSPSALLSLENIGLRMIGDDDAVSTCPELPVPLAGLANEAEDIAVSSDTNTLWVLSSRTLNEYSPDEGRFLATFTLDFGFTATGIAHVSDGLFAVVTDIFPRLHYYETSGAPNGTILTPLQTHLVQDDKGTIFQPMSLTYDAAKDLFYVLTGNQELHSMTREGVMSTMELRLEEFEGWYFVSGLHWEASTNHLMVLIRFNKSEPTRVYELSEATAGVWQLTNTPAVPTLPGGRGLATADNGQRVLTVNTTGVLFAYRTKSCDDLSMPAEEPDTVQGDELLDFMDRLPVSTLHLCTGAYPLSTVDAPVQDLTFRPSTKTLFVLAPKVLKEYTADGDILNSYRLKNSYLATGIAHVGGDIFAVVTETYPRLHYYNISGVESGEEVEPYETHTILLDGEPMSVNTLAYDQDTGLFFTANANQTLYSMTRDAILAPQDLDIDLEEYEYISALEWGYSTGSLSVLLRGRTYERATLLEIMETSPGLWQMEGNVTLKTVPLGISAAVLQDRVVVLTKLNALATFSTTTICDDIAAQFVTDRPPEFTNPELYENGVFGPGIDQGELWDIDGSDFEKANYKQCEPFAPLTALPEKMAEDVTFSSETNTIFVLAAMSLNEYTVDGNLISSYTLRNALNASGVTHVEGNVFAVVSIMWATINYYDLTGAINGDIIAPYLLLDTVLEDGEPITLSTLTYDPARDIFFTSSNNMEIYTMTRTGVVAEVEDLDLEGVKSGSVIAGLHWSEDRGAIYALVRGRQYDPISVQEVVEESPGRWKTDDRKVIPIIPTATALTFTPLGARMLLVTFLKELYVFSPDDGCDSVNLYRPEADTEVYLDEPNDWAGEPAFDKNEMSTKPYIDVIDGDKKFKTTFKSNKYYDVGPFIPPKGPLPGNWADECIANMRMVKEKLKQRSENRPNEECPAGFFLCKGMCYTMVQRNNRGPSYESGHQSYYKPDYMSVEARCGLCGRARVAFVGEDAEMKRVAAAAAEENLNEDKAIWVRRYRFLDEINKAVEKRTNPYQAWHRYVEMENESPKEMTYQRYYTGEKDKLDTPQYDARFRNQEGGILCVNTIERISNAVDLGEKLTRITWEGGCTGEDRDNKWDDRYHRWWPEDLWPYPGY